MYAATVYCIELDCTSVPNIVAIECAMNTWLIIIRAHLSRSNSATYSIFSNQLSPKPLCNKADVVFEESSFHIFLSGHQRTELVTH